MISTISENIFSSKTNKVTVIGFTGATRSGKSTLAIELKNLLPNAKLIQQDKYFNHEKIKINSGNWELIEVLDMEIMYNDFLILKSTLEKENHEESYIILEGFLLLVDSKIRDIIDIKIFLDIPIDEIYKRRMATKPESDDYFNIYIAPSYISYRKLCTTFNDLIFISGIKEKGQITQQVYDIIKKPSMPKLKMKADDTKIVIVGITGSTRSGKTCLSIRLQTELEKKAKSILIPQDNYYNDEKMSLNKENWESIEFLEMDDMYNDVKKAKKLLENEEPISKISYIILEGYLLFEDERIKNICDIRLWLEIPWSTIYERRMATNPVSDKYFYKCIIPCYEKYKAACKDIDNLISIDGLKPKEIVYKEALQIINNYSQ